MVSKEDIRNAAYELFALKGFGGTTIQNIASALDLQKQSLYSHYSSKNALIADVVREQTEILTDEVDITAEDLKGLPFDAALREMFKKFVGFFSNKTRLLFWKRVFLNVSDAEFSDTLAHIDLSFHDNMYITLRELAAEKSAVFPDEQAFKNFTAMFFSILQGYLDWMIVDPSAANKLDSVWSYLWDGLKTCYIDNAHE